MRLLFALGLLAGCDRVFSTDPPTPVDAAVDVVVVDASMCAGGTYGGNSGLFGVCLESTPAAVLVTDASINTGRQGLHECTQVVVQPDQTEVCVVAAGRIEITSKVRGEGSRPLVLVALEDLVVTATGELDVSSERRAMPAAGADSTGCTLGGTNGTAGTTTGRSGGGGAGGSFGGIGGLGGTGTLSGTPAAGGMPSAPSSPTTVRAGCRGGQGGAGDMVGTSGGAGQPGGALYLIAGRSITVAGRLNASGSPGGGGAMTTSGAGSGGGGGGGGSGGLIGLDAPSVVLTPTAIIGANGGGGGGGAGSTGNGGEGYLSDLTGTYPFVAGGGAAGAGNGGAGGASGHAGGVADAGASANAGGGGGGGAVGHVLIYATTRDIQIGARLSPAPGP